jgi:hypothetical protein
MAGAGNPGAGGRGPRAWLTAPIGIRVSSEGLTWAAVAVGVFLRLMGYAEARTLYMDERSLLDNLLRLQVFDFHTRLTENQLAPPAFLVLERMLVRLPGPRVMIARFFPMACGVASMFLFRAAARRFLRPHAVPIAVGLFALSDWLIYYTSELKQYSCDLSLTLVALLLAAGPSSGSPDTPGPAPLTARRLLGLGVFGAIGVWFSYPMALVLAAVGTYLLAVALIRRDARGILGLVGMGLMWVSSFAACYVVSHGILSTDRFIWDWWDFAFLRLPPRSMAELKFEFWQVLNIFDSPSDVKTPMGMIPTAMLALALSVAGAVSTLHKWPGGLYLLAAPVLFAMAASALHQYPFHGRLLIFLVPSVHMLVAEGAAALSRPGGWRLSVVMGAFLLFQPAVDAFWYRFVQPLAHVGYDSHGDLRHDLLDHIERLGAERSR